MTGRWIALLTASGLMAAPVCAQDWSFEAEATLAAGATDESSPAGGHPPGASAVLGSILLGAAYETALDSGLSIEWRGRARLDYDGERPGFAGVLADCSAEPCAAVVFPISPATGFAAGGQIETDEVRATLEVASLTLAGPLGEGVIGFDAGAAALLDARAPQVLNRVSAFSPGLDPTGLALTRARNDFTGSSAKLTYLSPRWLGFRVGASFTPRADLEGADFDPRPKIAGAIGADLEKVWEGALSFARTFRQSGVRLRAALTASTAESNSPLAGFGDLQAVGAGVEIEKGAWTGGIRWLDSDNGWRQGEGDYRAIEAGLVRQTGKWRIGAEIGWAEDKLLVADGVSWLVGAKRTISEQFEAGVAYLQSDDTLSSSTLGFRHINARNGALIVELTVRK